MKKLPAVQYFFAQSFEIIFPLLPLQHGSNIISVSSAKVFAFELKIWLLIWLFFNLKVVAATETISINHISERSTSASTELIYHMTVAHWGD